MIDRVTEIGYGIEVKLPSDVSLEFQEALEEHTFENFRFMKESNEWSQGLVRLFLVTKRSYNSVQNDPVSSSLVFSVEKEKLTLQEENELEQIRNTIDFVDEIPKLIITISIY